MLWMEVWWNRQKIVILESYRTADHVQTHGNSPHFQDIGVGTIIPLLENRSVSTHETATS